MPEEHAAFSAGEFVRFKTYPELQKVQNEFGVEGRFGKRAIHGVLAEDMRIHAGKRVRITSVNTYHMGTILYEFEGIEEFWLECTIVDQQLLLNDGADINQLASKFYTVDCESEGDGVGFVNIRGRDDGIIYCRLRKQRARAEAENISAVSEIRAKISFEIRYGFDAIYELPGLE